MHFKFWLGGKSLFQGTNFESMVFTTQGVLRHDSWSNGKVRSQILQCEKNGIKWILDLGVVMSQSWEKDADFLYLEKF